MPKPKLGYTAPLQVFLLPDQREALRKIAAAGNTTISHLIRDEVVARIIARNTQKAA